ncbi:Zein-binding domain containing protein [Trema orientale]|uniref:Zein-binding domain containing protein n=1 Tax=Trema orientale TaxID=63057 RepID=A0A2P5F7G4_TREOI|nr:Zein-binding domain containing protein [Trema orientale]
MKIICRLCILLVVWSILEYYRSLGLFVMEYSAFCLKFLTQNNDFGCGFCVFGFFLRVFGLFGLFLMFGLGLKLLNLSFWLPKGLNSMQNLCHFRAKTLDLGYGFSSKRCRFEAGDQNLVSCNTNGSNNVEEYHQNDEDEESDEDQCCCNEDEEFNVNALRKLVKIERSRAKKARKELEKERAAAASAAGEAMAVILRLQREKSCVEMEANQYRRMVEHKREYDDELIQHLRWIVMKHESERSVMEDELRLCKEILKLFTKGNDEILLDQFCEEVSLRSSNVEDNHDYQIDEFETVVTSPVDVDDCNN